MVPGLHMAPDAVNLKLRAERAESIPLCKFAMVYQLVLAEIHRMDLDTCR